MYLHQTSIFTPNYSVYNNNTHVTITSINERIRRRPIVTVLYAGIHRAIIRQHSGDACDSRNGSRTASGFAVGGSCAPTLPPQRLHWTVLQRECVICHAENKCDFSTDILCRSCNGYFYEIFFLLEIREIGGVLLGGYD